MKILCEYLNDKAENSGDIIRRALVQDGSTVTPISALQASNIGEVSIYAQINRDKIVLDICVNKFVCGRAEHKGWVNYLWEGIEE